MENTPNKLEIGKIGIATTLVSEKNTAQAVGSGSLPVFATPMMVALMEEAACNALEGALEEGQTSVGTAIATSHIAASPVGVTITAEAIIVSVDGRMITFEVLAKDENNDIGKGTHNRVVVGVERFLEKLVR